MNDFNSNKYAAPLENLLPRGFKFDKEALKCLCSILSELNSKFIDAILLKSGNDITAKIVKESIDPILPGTIKKYAFANAHRDVSCYSSGDLVYRIPKLSKVGILEPQMLRSSLEVLAKTAHRELTLSKDCTVITGLVQRLAVHIAETSVSAIQNDRQQSLQNLENIVRNMFGEELFLHAQGHAGRNLHWYRQNMLDFNLKPLSSHQGEVLQEPTVFAPSIRKIAKNNFHASLTKDASNKMEIIMSGILNTIVDDMKRHGGQNINQSHTISDTDIYNSVRNSLPNGLFGGISAHSQAVVLNYKLGMLEYSYTKSKKDIKMETETEMVPYEFINPDFRNGVKRIMDEQLQNTAQRERGFLVHMNSILNNLCFALADKCVESAQHNISNNSRKSLQENDVFNALNAVLPPNLKNHTFGRIYNVKERLNLPTIQSIETQLRGITGQRSTDTRTVSSSESLLETDSGTQDGQWQLQLSSAENTTPPDTDEASHRTDDDSKHGEVTPQPVPNDTHPSSKIHGGNSEEYPETRQNGFRDSVPQQLESNSSKENDASLKRSQELKSAANGSMNVQKEVFKYHSSVSTNQPRGTEVYANSGPKTAKSGGVSSINSVPQTGNHKIDIPGVSNAENAKSQDASKTAKHGNSENNGKPSPTFCGERSPLFSELPFIYTPREMHSLSKGTFEQSGSSRPEENQPLTYENVPCNSTSLEKESISNKDHEADVEQCERLKPEINGNRDGQNVPSGRKEHDARTNEPNEQADEEKSILAKKSKTI